MNLCPCSVDHRHSLVPLDVIISNAGSQTKPGATDRPHPSHTQLTITLYAFRTVTRIPLAIN